MDTSRQSRTIGVISYKRKRWNLPAEDARLLDRLGHELGLPPVVAQLLINRGFTEAAAASTFLEPRFRDLHSPYLLPNMHPAADRLADAARKREKITLYGDYDVDGITGTAMLWHTLTTAGAAVDYYIPHRVDEGYGLNPEAIESLANAGTKLLVTIDCGCSAIEPVALARRLGMDVIVSDHHEFASGGAELPPANAIVHPRLPIENRKSKIENPTSYPNPDLCGAGVAFKLAWALAQKLCNAERVNETYRGLLMEFTALAALGTIADVVPLTGENRILVKYGLAQLPRTRIPGLLALIHAAGYGIEGGKAIDSTAVGFALAPRLNAAGRMGHAREAVELLTTAAGDRADEIARWLESQNRDRQSTERKMLNIAREQIENQKSKIKNQKSILVVAHESFHAGVVGIVASRLVDIYNRPAFVLASAGGEAHGSARSIPGFALHLAIEHVRDLLITGGGHAMAGGVTMAADKLEVFRQRMAAYGQEHLTDEMLAPAMEIDGLLDLRDCVPEVIGLMERLAPFGRGNPPPRFLLENVRLTAPPRRVGATGAHLQLTVGTGGGGDAGGEGGPMQRAARCIAFKMGPLEPQLPVGIELHLVVEPKVDVFNGREKVDLVVADVARGDGEPFEACG